MIVTGGKHTYANHIFEPNKFIEMDNMNHNWM